MSIWVCFSSYSPTKFGTLALHFHICIFLFYTINKVLTNNIIILKETNNIITFYFYHYCYNSNLYIYIYKTETFEAPIIFHVSTILKKNFKKTFKTKKNRHYQKEKKETHKFQLK